MPVVKRRAEGVGGRVAQLRKLAGLTQEQLAQRAHISRSLLKKVETGAAPASPAFTAAVARVLGVTVPDLYDQPAPRFGDERGHIEDLETAIMEGAAAGALLDRPPATADQLAAGVAEIQRLQRYSRYAESSAMMPDLLRQLHMAAVTAPSGEPSERAHHLLATTYECAVICLHRLGSPLCGWAAERATAAAQHSGDPLLVAVVGADRGLPLMHRGSYQAAQAFADDAMRLISDERPTPETLAVRGSVLLRWAIIAARCGDRASSDAYLAEARDLAQSVPTVDYEHTDYYDTAFSGANVEIHAVAAAVEMTDGTLAVTRARNLVLSPGTMRSRLAHHHIDVARAWQLHGDRDRCLDSLNAARRLAPQQTRYHPQVHETTRALAHTAHRKVPSLHAFASWLGLNLDA